MIKPENDRRAFLKTLAIATIGGATALLVATQAQAQAQAKTQAKGQTPTPTRTPPQLRSNPKVKQNRDPITGKPNNSLRY